MLQFKTVDPVLTLELTFTLFSFSNTYIKCF